MPRRGYNNIAYVDYWGRHNRNSKSAFTSRTLPRMHCIYEINVYHQIFSELLPGDDTTITRHGRLTLMLATEQCVLDILYHFHLKHSSHWILQIEAETEFSFV
jgi:hypothetical protein